MILVVVQSILNYAIKRQFFKKADYIVFLILESHKKPTEPILELWLRVG